jgi:hypothetical protein
MRCNRKERSERELGVEQLCDMFCVFLHKFMYSKYPMQKGKREAICTATMAV